jgi:chromosome segregation ATPase
MALDERERLELRHTLVEALGPEQGHRLMDQVPSFDWADVAMKSDLAALEVVMKSDLAALEVAMKSDLVALEERLDVRFERVDTRFERIEGRFENVEGRLDNIEGRFENVDRRFENIERQLGNLELQFPAIHAQFATVNHQLDKLLARPENNRTLFLALIGVIVAVASLTLAAATFAN